MLVSRFRFARLRERERETDASEKLSRREFVCCQPRPPIYLFPGLRQFRGCRRVLHAHASYIRNVEYFPCAKSVFPRPRPQTLLSASTLFSRKNSLAARDRESFQRDFTRSCFRLYRIRLQYRPSISFLEYRFFDVANDENAPLRDALEFRLSRKFDRLDASNFNNHGRFHVVSGVTRKERERGRVPIAGFLSGCGERRISRLVSILPNRQADGEPLSLRSPPPPPRAPPRNIYFPASPAGIIRERAA